MGQEIDGDSTPAPRRRRATSISAVDQHLIDQGLPPSWEESEGAAVIAARVARKSTDSANRAGSHGQGGSDLRQGGAKQNKDLADTTGGNDERLLSEVPPHWHSGLD